MKRILSIVLSLCLILSCAAIFGGCNTKTSNDWPVTIGDVTIDKEPENIVVLNDVFADVISYIGYDIKMAGRSEECDQEFLHVVPVMGKGAAPDTAAIAAAKTDLVIADKTLSADAKSAIEANSARPKPSWMDVDSEHMSATVTKLPDRSEIDFDIEEHFIVELYSK